MLEWIKKNGWSTTFAAAAVGIALMGLLLSGCQMSDLIKVDVPKDVQEAVDSEPKVTLTAAPDLWDDWQAYVKRNTEKLESRTERAYELLGFINSATDMALVAAEGAAPAFPGGAILVGLLGGTAGLFLKRPGTDKQIAKEKEASYNAGMEKARELAAAAGLEPKDGADA